MSVFDAIEKRRSIRNYKPDSIPKDVLDRLLNAIRLAPSGGNQQPYKFIVVQDKEIKVKLAAACRWTPGAPKGHAFIAEAPAAIVACSSEKGAISRFYIEEGKVDEVQIKILKLLNFFHGVEGYSYKIEPLISSRDIQKIAALEP